MNSHLKICYIAPEFDERASSGGLKVIFEHCNRLLSRGHEVTVFNNIGVKSKYLKLDCDILRHNNDPAVITAWEPDIIVGTHSQTYFFIRRIKLPQSKPAAFFMLIQSNDMLLASEENAPFIEEVLTGFCDDGRVINKIAISDYMAKFLMDDFNQSSFLIRNGFDPSEVDPIFPPDNSRIRITTRYDPSSYRGWDLVNSALVEISKTRNNIEIHLFDTKKRPATTYKSVFHEGLTGDKLYSLFRSCDIFVAGNKTEGFSYATLEPMSQGCAVCCTDAGGNLEFCIDGETALVSKSRDVRGLVKNINRLVDDKSLRERMSKSGIQKSREFSWDKSIDILESVFQKTLSAGKPATYNINAVRPGQSQSSKRGLIVWGVDPFGKYTDWVYFEEFMRAVSGWGVSADVIMLVDRHSIKTVRARFEIMAPDVAGEFSPLILYVKKQKFIIPRTVSVLLLKAFVLSRLSYVSITGKGGYENVITVGLRSRWGGWLMRALSKGKLTNLGPITFDSSHYIFGKYGKDHALKVAEYRNRISNILNDLLSFLNLS